MIKFIQHSSPKYPPRTYENASADATIAFAFDFSTAGERLTLDAVHTQNKLYIPVNAALISSLKIKTTATHLSDRKVGTLNIAGNGLYTAQRIDKSYTQDAIDAIVYQFLYYVLNHPAYSGEITLIRSGGQSGFDEAGLKAAVRLHIPALCVCPQGWKFMNGDGKTICDEHKFKERFKGVLVL